MKTYSLRMLALLAVVFFASGCEPETEQECRTSTQCPSELTCLDSRCQAPDASLPDVDEDPIEGDCRVEPCAEGLLCNETTGACENCTLDEQCEEFAVCHASERVCTCQAGYVRCGGVCVPQNSVQSCANPCEPCPDVEHGEPICAQQTCSATCDEGFFLCEEGCEGTPGTCVECLNNTHCPDAEAPACHQGACGGCASNDDCAGVEGKGVCDVESGACVECLGDQSQACGDFSCDPATQACTTTERGSRSSCETCRSDAECEADHTCMTMTFAGEPRDSAYCLRIDTAPAGEPTNCPEPFTVLDIKENATTGELEIVCGINEALTTCEAVLDYDSPCGDVDDCGAPGLDDAVCEPIEFEPLARCSFPCDSSLEYPQCYALFRCAFGTNGYYCGAT